MSVKRRHVALPPLVLPNTPSSEKIARHTFGQERDAIDVPNLIETQMRSFEWFRTEGLKDLFREISPITDFTGKNLELTFGDFHFGEPRHTEHECRELDLTFSAPLRVNVQLRIFSTGEIKVSDTFLGDFPLMTENGTFVINGAERVVVSQLIRSPGVYFSAEEDSNTGRKLHSAKLIPNRGAWLEFETSKRDIVSVKVDRKRKMPVTVLLRAISAWQETGLNTGHWCEDNELANYGHTESILEYFDPIEQAFEHKFIRATLEKDNMRNAKEALIELYKRLRPGDPPTLENARNLLEQYFFSERRYDLAKVGRYKLNKNLYERNGDMNPPSGDTRVLLKRDIFRIVERIINLNNKDKRFRADDIDHLGNRRVRTVGELIQQQFRVGLLRMERVIKDRMGQVEAESATPNNLINIRPVLAAIREWFGGSQLSQFMDQTNPLAELTNKRRLSALGPGGLSRDRAGFEVRDVHHSHYGRICPVETPEGPNIGLIGTMSTYARVNEMGFLETPYRRVYRELPTAAGILEDAKEGRKSDGPVVAIHDYRHLTNGELLLAAGTLLNGSDAQKMLLNAAATFFTGQRLREDVVNPKTGKTIGEAGQDITAKMAAEIAALPLRVVQVMPVVSRDVIYLTADMEEIYTIAQANVPMDEMGRITDEIVSCRKHGEFVDARTIEIDYMDVSPKQVVSVSTALIPFLEHDDANRALMGSNMQRQAVPLLRPDAPIVGTGIEHLAARDSGQVIVAKHGGIVESVTGDKIVIVRCDANGNPLLDDNHAPIRDEYQLRKFMRSNQDTCINQRPSVISGQVVKKNDVIVDSSSTDNGELALGQNVLVAFMPWEGGNFEDAILVSERLVREDVFTSIHIERYETEARETKLGPEEITRDIPNVGPDSLRNLDDRGIIYVGAEVHPNDILVGKITPKGETELTAEERLLRAIFGEKAREVKDSSLRVQNGVRGKVIGVKHFDRDSNDDVDLAVGVNQKVQILLCQKRKISAGDKMAGRHGNKGVVSRILPVEDMPFLEDGTPVDIILNPIGVPSRMNLGQILETHLGWAAERLGMRIATPVFDGATEDDIQSWLGNAGLPQDGKVCLFDGRTGLQFHNPVTVGYIYMLKLAHLVEDKIHARSTGPYSLVTQQPLGGKAQFGGQRFGEMEVWALEAYGAAYILQEMLTVKSDDVVGRVKTYEAIVKGVPIKEVGVPESFKVLIKELQSLGLSVDVLSDDALPVQLNDDMEDHIQLDGINISGRERDE
ncbi:MAG: DNA-directed RNA polymerase subunit beta [Roseiflexaceae bacterium]|jgi:DNA-directed RNA polymerase subunit beta|nr:DNA-directed RNA polymerase subunit beta [Chloroflexaceae bacterium]